MKNIRKNYEIMAPVGSFESLQAAIQAGTDSVYFGIEKMNMRARSSVNFTKDDLKEIVRICKKNNIKTYLTVNIIIYDEEIEQAKELVDFAKEAEITAIIASDQSIIQYAFEKGVEIHISTQLSISNFETVKFYSNFADVMVLARELDLNKVKYITDKIKEEDIWGPKGELIKIEIFAHGALCMSISGKCYLSLHEMNYSANRGACLQTCRKGYTVINNESGEELGIDNEYIMSPKDLKTIHFLNKVLDSGVTVLKIEGRARPAEYVHTVVKCYDEAIKAYIENDFTKDKIEDWDKRLATVFNRGFWDGYYLGQRLGEWSEVYGSRATKKKIYVAKGTNYFNKLKVAEFLCETGELEVGDDILITGPTTGVIQTKITEIRVDLENVDNVTKGQRFSIPVDQIVRRSDKLYKMKDAIEKQKIN